MKNYLHVENCPNWKKFWILIDESNGHSGARTYFWVFGTKKEARNHKREQSKKEFGAKLSKPIKVINK